jgi:hypothetical protein
MMIINGLMPGIIFFIFFKKVPRGLVSGHLPGFFGYCRSAFSVAGLPVPQFFYYLASFFSLA